METKVSQTELTIGDKKVTLETGLFGAQANGAVVARCGDTEVLAAVVSGSPREGIDYFPLQVEYREKYYAGGVISSSRFVKREGRPADNEILTSRLIDRSIRPLFPSNFFDEVQVIVNPLSYDGENEPEILGIIAASAALRISDLPWAGPVGAVRVAMSEDGKYIVNPTETEKKTSRLDMVLSGTAGSLAMVETGAEEVTEAQILEAMKAGQKAIDSMAKQIDAFGKECGKTKRVVEEEVLDKKLVKLVADKVDPSAILGDSKTAGGEGIKIGTIVDELVGDDEEIDRNQLTRLVDEAIKIEMRKGVLEKGVRFDGRKADEIRQINVQVGLLPRAHGSGFFQRGLTHALSVVTLGSPDDAQLMEGMKGESTKRYMHHYNMPGFATGEPGRVGAPNRREIGHGALAERALVPVIPTAEEFPYTIRVVSEIMSGNGSTSQASICGSTLSLMDAGVPIKKPVAGIAMGLIWSEEKFVTLSDIAGLEDHFGDMDFKVAGTRDGVTAMQMDVKIPGVTAEILETALEQAHEGRMFIMDKMTAVIDKPRAEISKWAPRIETIKIDPEKIGTVIGTGGKTIRQIQTDFEVEINVEEDGTVAIMGLDSEKVKNAAQYVKDLCAGPEVGRIYDGVVKRLMDFGAFVEIMPGIEGLVHVSNMGKGFVGKASDVLKEGDKVKVKVYEVDSQGRVNLTMDMENDPTTGRGGNRGGGERGGGFGHRGGDRGDRGDRGGSRGGGSRGGFSRPRPRSEEGSREGRTVFDRRRSGRSERFERGGNQSRFKRFTDHR